MRLVASTPNSNLVPEAIRNRLAAISQDDLRKVVERISDTDREFRAGFDREGGATCLDRVRSREIGA